MSGQRIDSKGWTGDLESQTAPGFRGVPAEPGPVSRQFAPTPRWRDPLTPDQFWGRVHAVLLGAAGFLYLAANSIVRGVTGDLTVATPLAGKLILLALPAGVLLYAVLRRRRAAPIFRRIAQTGWIATLLGALVYAGVGISAHHAAATGPIQRAQIEGWKRHGKWGGYEMVFALADGSRVTADGASPSGRNCYEVRRVTGGGFVWLRIVARASAPEAGQLNWPIDRAACFSAAPLASVGGS